MKPNKISFWASAFALLLLGSVDAAEKSPERKVHGNSITSMRDPAVQVTLPASAHYVGGERWDLYGVADCEVHVFVEADAQKRLQRLYWVQFEAYLPDNTHAYGYPFTEKVTHAGLEFDVAARFGPTNQASRPGSDSERVMSLLTRAGYHMPPESMNVRLVHLLDDSKRKEIMFIYAEDLASTGSTVEELKKPEANPKWLDIKGGLLNHALERIQIEMR